LLTRKAVRGRRELPENSIDGLTVVKSIVHSIVLNELLLGKRKTLGLRSGRRDVSLIENLPGYGVL